MANVYNWQLGRAMTYPFAPGLLTHQFGAVFNINRCIGCQTCTMACKSTWTFSKGQELMWWNNVESKPFGGYPHFWDSKLLSLLGPQPGWTGTPTASAPFGQYTGRTIFEAAPTDAAALGYLPDDLEWISPNIYEDTTSGSPTQTGGIWDGASLPEHKIFFFYLQRICNHCTYPACVAACPRKAIYKREEDGVVLIDQKRCRGYRKCVEACPYKKPMFRPTTGTSEKCIGCYPRLEEGATTRCISACVGKIRLFGWVDDPQSPIHYLVKQEQVALPLYPQFGTEPNVYYIPPRWVPLSYLHQMFGPGVEAALEKYRNPSWELLGVLQLFGATQTILASYEVTATHAIGYDEAGNEAIRVAIEDELVVRPEQHLNIT